MIRSFTTFFAALLLFQINGMAGVKIVSNSKPLDCGNYSIDGQTVMFLRQDIMRLDMTSERHKTSMIFKKNERKMWILDHRQQKYYTITQQDLDFINENLKKMRSSMDESMKNMSEAQKKQMSEQVAKQFGSIYDGREAVHYQKKEDTKSINGWTCQKYEFMKGKTLKGILWTAEIEEVGLKRDEIQILRDFSNFIKVQFESFSFGASFGFVSPDHDFEGLPMESVEIRNGNKCTVSTVESIEKIKLKNNLFQIPDAYRKDENPIKQK